MHQRPVSLAEDHEGIHRPPDVFLVSFTLQGAGSIIIISTTVSVKEVYGMASIYFIHSQLTYTEIEGISIGSFMNLVMAQQDIGTTKIKT